MLVSRALSQSIKSDRKWGYVTNALSLRHINQAVVCIMSTMKNVKRVKLTSSLAVLNEPTPPWRGILCVNGALIEDQNLVASTTGHFIYYSCVDSVFLQMNTDGFTTLTVMVVKEH